MIINFCSEEADFGCKDVVNDLVLEHCYRYVIFLVEKESCKLCKYYHG